MKNSIILKTTVSIVLALFIILLSIGTYVTNSQKEVINELISNQKVYIKKTINRISKTTIREALKSINTLAIATSDTFANAITNEDENTVKITIRNIMKKKNIMALSLYDLAIEDFYIVAYKKDSKVFFDKNLPLLYKNYDFMKFDLKVENDLVGYMKIHFDNVHIAIKIKSMKTRDIEQFDTSIEQIEAKIEERMRNRLLGLALGALLLILLIYNLLKTLVSKPLIIVKDSLDNFFDFLQNKTDKVEPINLNTNDEFGIMAKSINENIIVSAKLHSEIKELNLNLESKIQERTHELNEKNSKIEKSIRFASLIQQTFNHNDEIVSQFFNDYFIILKQRDTVGGDMILFEKLNNNECLFFIIDCTSHGVPGAFVSMIVKSLQRQIIKDLPNNKEISTSKILSTFNAEIKELLQQTSSSSNSNVGFDGQIVYYNKSTNMIKFSSAKNDIVKSTKNKIERTRGDRHSAGYKDSKIDYTFTEHILEIKEDTSFYFYSDGFTDQIGGDDLIPFGNKNTLKLLKKCKEENMPMNIQKQYLLNNLKAYQNKNEQNDDMSFVGLHIKGVH